MACSQGKDLDRWLQGLLSARRAELVMDHLRTCDPCKTHLNTLHASAPTFTKEPQDKRYQSYSAFEVETAKQTKPKTRYRGFIGMFIIVLLTYAGIHAATGTPKGPKRTRSDDLLTEAAEAALTRGVPLISSNLLEGPRPRLLRGYLPEPLSKFTLRISRDGERIFQKDYTLDTPGVEVYPRSKDLISQHVVLPFPRATECPLEVESVYTWRLILPSAKTSPPRSFRVTKP